MDRRKFFSVTGAGAAAVAAGSRAGRRCPPPKPRRRPRQRKLPPLKARLGHQFGTLTDRNAAWVARYGVDAICTSPKVADPARLYPTVDEMKADAGHRRQAQGEGRAGGQRAAHLLR